MKEYVIQWDAGFGQSREVVKTENEEEAEKIAYEYCKEDFESHADYFIVGEATDELKEEYGM